MRSATLCSATRTNQAVRTSPGGGRAPIGHGSGGFRASSPSLPWLKLEQTHAAPAMARFDSPHFLLEQLEDGWMLEATHVTKDADGDWMLDHDELVELRALLQQALG